MSAGAGRHGLVLTVVILAVISIAALPAAPGSDTRPAAVDSGPVWLSVPVPGGTTASHPAFILDVAASPHLAFYSSAGEAILYASQSGGAWQVETAVPGLASLDSAPGLAIDGSGAIHLAFIAPDRRLGYVSRSCGGSCAWSSPAWLAESLLPGALAALAVDAYNRPHVLSFQNTETGSVLRDFYLFDGEWLSRNVDAASGSGAQAVLALDLAGRLNAVYLAEDGSLVHAWLDGPAWQHTSTGLTGADLPQVLWQDGLYLAFYQPAARTFAVYQRGTGWQEVLPAPPITLPDGASGLSFQVRSGRPYLAYAEPNGDLAFAFLNSQGQWDVSPVPGGGSQPVLRLDGSGFPNLAYLDTSGALILSRRAYPLYIPAVLR